MKNEDRGSGNSGSENALWVESTNVGEGTEEETSNASGRSSSSKYRTPEYSPLSGDGKAEAGSEGGSSEGPLETDLHGAASSGKVAHLQETLSKQNMNLTGGAAPGASPQDDEQGGVVASDESGESPHTRDEEFSRGPIPIPHEYTLPKTVREYIPRSIFAWAIVGEAVGALAVIIQARIAAGSFDKLEMENFFSTHQNIMERYPAWGVVAGLGMALVVMPLVYGIAYSHERRRGRTNVYQPIDPPKETHERARHRFLPSTSPFYPIDLRAFLGVQAFGLFGKAYLAWKASKFVGDVDGPAIGVLGAVLAVAHHPAIARRIAKYFDREPQKIKPPGLLRESRHDVPGYVRLFSGAVIGFILASIIHDDPFADHSAHRQFLATSLGAGATFVFPYLMAFSKIMLKYCRSDDYEDQNFTAPGWYRPTQIDFPYYVRYMAGVVSMAVFQSSVKAYVGKNGSAGHWGAWVAGTVLLPVISEIFARVASASCTWGQDERADPLPPSLSVDLPLEIRVAFASVVGMMMGGALEYFKSGTPTNMKLQLLCVGWMTLLAVAAPAAERFSVACFPEEVCKFFGLSRPSTDDTKENANLNMPFYIRALVGAWAGAVVATAFGSLGLISGDRANVANGFIGPTFTGISNAIGAPAGTFLGGVVGILWPYTAAPVLEKAAKWVDGKCCRLMVERRSMLSGDDYEADPGHITNP